MSIPANITRAHIIRAIQRIDRERQQNILPQRRLSRKYFLRYINIDYPPKLVISYANVYPNREELNPHPSVFTTYMAQIYLRGLDFEIVGLQNARRR